jgi:hypothetical protein
MEPLKKKFCIGTTGQPLAASPLMQKITFYQSDSSD